MGRSNPGESGARVVVRTKVLNALAEMPHRRGVQKAGNNRALRNRNPTAVAGNRIVQR